MPPFRFLHAAGLDPDAVLPHPPAGLGEVFQSAPLAAVERLVTRAIELSVDFVLATPAATDQGLLDGPSLAAESALREQFERLADEDVPIFVAVASRASAWTRLGEGDSHVVVLPPNAFTPIADREGRRCAVLRCVERVHAADSSIRLPKQDETLELAIAPRISAQDLAGVAAARHDYLGLGVGSRKTLSLGSGIAHAPAAIQGVNETAAGPHGATLVTIDEAGKFRTDLVPTAAVRFERFLIAAERSDQLDDLAVRMSDQLATVRPEPGEQAWMIRWTLEAADSLFETLNAPAGRADIVSLLPQAVGGIPVVHRMNVVPDRLAAALDDPFAAEFAAVLKEQEAALGDAARRLALLGIPNDLSHGRRLRGLLSDADRTAISGAARRFGMRVATAAADESGEE